MPHSRLLYTRFFVPAVILVVLSYAVAKILNVTSQGIDLNVNDFGYNLSYLVIAAIYQYLPFRGWAHGPFRKRVDKRIRNRLVKISGLDDDEEKFAWERVKNVFYSIIDNDKSLEKRSEAAMFNGALMTSFADLSAISALFLLGFGVALLFGFPTGRVNILLVGLLAVSILMQCLATYRHYKLSDDQLDYIQQQLKSEVVEKMKALNA